jgi:glucosyl-dolichyl phosphate glucuronosyltransferase
MSKKVDVAVIIPTYNRASMLASAIESILCQTCSGINYELVVVDNNSNDDTHDVVQSFIRRGENVRYLFEREQGVSHARNLGIKNTSADILAFLDDDVIAPSDWVEKIKRRFDRHPDALFVGGKVLPRWKTQPPTWLTAEHWSPLALIDYGNESFFVDRNTQVCLVSANLAVRRTAFDRFGPFTTELDRCEDHEFELRLLRSGGKGLYVPELVVTADVQNERLMKSYHRTWWSGRGKRLARFRAYEISRNNADSDKDDSGTIKLFGTPSYVYKQLLTNAFGWLSASIRRKESKAFYSESQMRDALNYIRETYSMSARESLYSRLAEVGSFAPKLALKKIRNYLN